MKRISIEYVKSVGNLVVYQLETGELVGLDAGFLERTRTTDEPIYSPYGDDWLVKEDV